MAQLTETAPPPGRLSDESPRRCRGDPHRRRAIDGRVAELGAQLAADYDGRDPVLVSVLKGCARLPRRPHACHGPAVEHRPHGGLELRRATETSGRSRILKDLSKPIEGRDVIVVEDIIDTGLTLNYLLRYLAERKPASIKIVLPARQAGAPPGRDLDRLPRVHDPGPVRHRLRARLRRALPQPAIHRCAQAVRLRRRATRRGSGCMDGGGGRFRILILLGSLADDRLRLSAVVARRRGHGRRGASCLRTRESAWRVPGSSSTPRRSLVLVLLDVGYMRGRWGFFLDAPCGLSHPGPGRWRRARLSRLAALVGGVPAASAAVARSRPRAVGVALVLYGAGTGFGVPKRY